MHFKFVLDADSEKFNPVYVTATFLDPFYKLTLNPEMSSKAKRYLLEKLEDAPINAEVQEVTVRDEPQDEVEVANVGTKLILPVFLKLSEGIILKTKEQEAGDHTFSLLENVRN